MKEGLTAVFEKSPHGYIGYVEELPGANTQGSTLEETKAHLVEAVRLVLQVNRQLTEEELASGHSDVEKKVLEIPRDLNVRGRIKTKKHSIFDSRNTISAKSSNLQEFINSGRTCRI